MTFAKHGDGTFQGLDLKVERTQVDENKVLWEMRPRGTLWLGMGVETELREPCRGQEENRKY